MKWLHSRKGFTLIELMIVILIIAILVAIAVPVYLSATAAAKRRTCQANQRTIDGAITAYNGFYEVYPATGASVNTILGAAWLKRMPSCPDKTNSEYSLVGGYPPSIPPNTTCPTGDSGHVI
ncbi:MAG TPA: prepilin-type N-terminal cleavage/methylation domain-containing protein [Candidatus Anoxymicrobiaceae bacterium]